MSWKYYPKEFSSYEEYVKYLKEKGLALESPEGMYNTKTGIVMTTLQKIQTEDSIHKRKVLIGRYLSEKMKYYEKQIAMSSDNTQCDDIDYIILASDMFDTLQMIEQNCLIL